MNSRGTCSVLMSADMMIGDILLDVLQMMMLEMHELQVKQVMGFYSC